MILTRPSLAAAAALALVTALVGCGGGGGGTSAAAGPPPGGPASHVRLARPEALVFDDDGDLYVSQLGGRVVEVTPAGRLKVVAGTGVNGYAGDGARAVAARLSDPNGLALDGDGNLLIADWGNDVIRRVDASGEITTFVRSAKLARPIGLAYQDGDLFVADTGKAAILRVDPAGTFSVVTEGVDAAYFAFDATGNLDFADFGHNSVGQIDRETLSSGRTDVISTLAGTGKAGFGGDGGPATAAELHGPYGVAIDAGDIYVSDSQNHRVRRIDPDGIITTVAGTGAPGWSGDGGSARRAELNVPAGLALDGKGNLYIADQRNNRVRRVDAATGVIATVAGNGR
jgi:trimeric autotransporter adhesin